MWFRVISQMPQTKRRKQVPCLLPVLLPRPHSACHITSLGENWSRTYKTFPVIQRHSTVTSFSKEGFLSQLDTNVLLTPSWASLCLGKSRAPGRLLLFDFPPGNSDRKCLRWDWSQISSGGHGVSPGTSPGRTASQLSWAQRAQQLPWSERGDDGFLYKMRRVRTAQGTMPAPSGSLEAASLSPSNCALGACMCVDPSAPLYSPSNLTTPSPLCSHTYDLRLLLRRRHYLSQW